MRGLIPTFLPYEKWWKPKEAKCHASAQWCGNSKESKLFREKSAKNNLTKKLQVIIVQVCYSPICLLQTTTYAFRSESMISHNEGCYLLLLSYFSSMATLIYLSFLAEMLYWRCKGRTSSRGVGFRRTRCSIRANILKQCLTTQSYTWNKIVALQQLNIGERIWAHSMQYIRDYCAIVYGKKLIEHDLSSNYFLHPQLLHAILMIQSCQRGFS